MIEHPDAIILGTQRSGTHLLQSSLSSHPAVHGRGEYVLHFKRLTSRGELEASLHSDRYKYIFSNMPGFMNIAIVMYSQIEMFERLSGSILDYKVIHLLRDPLAVAASVAQMKADRRAQGAEYRAHYKQGEAIPTSAPITPEEVAETESRVRGLQARFREKLGGSKRAIEIDYEEMTDNKQINQLPDSVSHRLLDFLSLERRPLRTFLQKTGGRGGKPEMVR